MPCTRCSASDSESAGRCKASESLTAGHRDAKFERIASTTALQVCPAVVVIKAAIHLPFTISGGDQRRRESAWSGLPRLPRLALRSDGKSLSEYAICATCRHLQPASAKLERVIISTITPRLGKTCSLQPRPCRFLLLQQVVVGRPALPAGGPCGDSDPSRFSSLLRLSNQGLVGAARQAFRQVAIRGTRRNQHRRVVGPSFPLRHDRSSAWRLG